MTHLSSFRYGEALKEPPTERRGCSEVRISYFDPRTGEPCKEKPKPVSIPRAKRQTAQEHFEQRRKDEAEAAEVIRNMKARREKERKEKRKKGNSTTCGRGGRPVLVDGELFKTVTEAAAEIGVHGTYLSKQLRAGARECHGRRVEYAEVPR